VFEGQSLTFGASIGVAIYLEDGELPDALTEKADQEMYIVKRKKKETGRDSPRPAP
jgi:GGDEF domain-containing protein